MKHSERVLINQVLDELALRLPEASTEIEDVRRLSLLPHTIPPKTRFAVLRRYAADEKIDDIALAEVISKPAVEGIIKKAGANNRGRGYWKKKQSMQERPIAVTKLRPTGTSPHKDVRSS